MRKPSTKTYRRIFIAYLVVVFALTPSLVIAHGSSPGPDPIGNYVAISKDGNSLFYNGQYTTTEIHLETHARLCLWHKNANGWHAHTSTCQGNVRVNGYNVRAPGQGSYGETILCPEGGGPWYARMHGWVVGSNGTVHLDRYLNSFQKTINC